MDRRECDHCGTVARALTIWPEEIHRSCQCWCHALRKEHDDKVAAKQRKKTGLK